MSAHLYFTSVSFFLFCRLISEVAEWNSTKIGHIISNNLFTNDKGRLAPLTWSEVSVIWKCMSESGTPPPPINRGPKNHLLGPTSQLNGNFNGLYLPNETRYRQSVKCVDICEGCATSCQTRHELWSTNSFKVEVSFHPPSVNSAFHFIASLHRRRSAKGTQPHFAKRWTVGRTKNLS